MYGSSKRIPRQTFERLPETALNRTDAQSAHLGQVTHRGSGFTWTSRRQHKSSAAWMLASYNAGRTGFVNTLRLPQVHFGKNPQNADHKAVASHDIELLGVKRPSPAEVELVGERWPELFAEKCDRLATSLDTACLVDVLSPALD